MSKPHLLLSSKEQPDLSLKSIDETDAELIRLWKNANRESFFFKDIITEAMQREWFAKYTQRTDDCILMVLANGLNIGCIGFRRLGDRVDLYNIMRGEVGVSRDGMMSRALELVCEEAERCYPGIPIMVSVLRSNPALRWYHRRGFEVVVEHLDHVELRRTIGKIGESI